MELKIRPWKSKGRVQRKNIESQYTLWVLMFKLHMQYTLSIDTKIVPLAVISKLHIQCTLSIDTIVPESYLMSALPILLFLPVYTI